jgi:Plasmid recombination enzyme
MADSQCFIIDSVNSKSTSVLAALNHNKRAIQANRGALGDINATRTTLNYCLAGDSTPDAINKHYKAQLAYAGINKLRKNGVLLVEIVFSLPITRRGQDTRPFFKDCLAFTRKHFSNIELISFDVHLDQAADHAHALLMPLIDGKLQGDKVKGNRANIQRLRDLFYSEVGSKHGLANNASKRLSVQETTNLAHKVLKMLKSDSVRSSSVWAVVSNHIRESPQNYAELLGIEIKQSNNEIPIKSFVDIKRSHGAGVFIK